MLSDVLIQNENGDYVQYWTDNSGRSDGRPDCACSRIRHIPPQLGQGCFTTHSITAGLELGICSGRFYEEYSAKVILDEPQVYFGFCLQGQTLTSNSYHQESVAMVSGRSTVFFFDDPVLIRKINREQNVFSFVIRVSPAFLRDLLCPAEGSWLQDLLLRQLQRGFIFFDYPLSVQMKMVLYQIVNSPYQGQVGRLYLESKAYELIALQLEQIEQQAGPHERVGRLSAGERERIYCARDRLIRDLQFPPSLVSLAKQIGVSHTRLNRGFKRFFGCTVFAYLRRERLAYARMLLDENNRDLSWVAYEAGFCSSSHFAASFQREYGVRPSDYRKSFAPV